ncbi:transforming growth factor beta receptor type 3 [Aplochiton taeniatus]
MSLSVAVSAESEEVPCSLSPAGALHPVQGLLERFDAGTGCAARESGDKETHVISVGKATCGANKQVTVILRPLSLPRSPRRVFSLVLSSHHAVHWWLEAEGLPPGLPVLVQVSPKSTVQFLSLAVRVQPEASLPFRPRALLRWTQQNHGSLSSLTHTAQANRVYIRLGDDPAMPSVCRLQSLFLSHNYLASDLQPQEVQGCVPDEEKDNSDPEVHVIKLHSAGSALCGSLQVEVSVSLVPPVANAGWHNVVLVLSSGVPVNWALSVKGLRGHISVYSSHSVSQLYPPEFDLSLTSMFTPDLASTPDLLSWANENGFPKVNSYTEADLANRFVVRLAGGGKAKAPSLHPSGGRLPWAEEHRLRQWLNMGASVGREAVSVECQDGRLEVAVDRHTLQTLSLPVSVVTLRDPECQAMANGSHFLLAFPIISCGTQGRLQGDPRGMRYTNMVRLWRNDPRIGHGHNHTGDRETRPLVIHFSCLAVVPSHPSLPELQPTQQPVLGSWGPLGPSAGYLPRPKPRPGPLLSLQLFVTESYEQRQTGPCVITAENRVYVEGSAKDPIDVGVELRSCTVSPLSDPRKSLGWAVITDGCSVDQSLTLSKTRGDREEEEEKETRKKGGERRTGGGRNRRQKRNEGMKGEEETHRLRFSFVLRPLYNNSVQFLHCSLRLCGPSLSPQGSPTDTGTPSSCQGGLRFPVLVSGPPSQQCEIRNLTRPMLVTQPVGMARLMAPSAVQRARRPSVSQISKPSPEPNSSGVDLGPVLGIVFAAFAMGISLMGALWCIHTHTGRPPPIRQGSLLDTADQSNSSHSTWNPLPLLDQSNSSV